MNKNLRFLLLALFFALPLAGCCTSDDMAAEDNMPELALPAAPAPAPVVQTSAAPNETSLKEVREALNEWVAAISTGSSDAVMKLYAPEAVLLPTLSPQICNTPELRKAYFDELTKKPGLRATVTDVRLRGNDEVAVASGLYTFSFRDGDKVVQLPARFTFVYVKGPNGWKIIEHHSSVVPEAH